MSDKKYELTDETIEMNGRTLHRIRALKAFTNHGLIVEVGDLGGYVESGGNLSQDGTAWIGGNAMALEGARVQDDALVNGNAYIGDFAIVEGQANVFDRASVNGNCIVSDNAYVGGLVDLDGFVSVFGHAWISDSFSGIGNNKCLLIGGDRCICGNAVIWGEKDMLSLPELHITAWKSINYGAYYKVRYFIEIADDETGDTCTLTEFKEKPMFKEKYGDLMEPIVDLIKTYFKKTNGLISILIPFTNTNTEICGAIEQSGLTVKQIADKSGVKQGTINSWLYTNRQPRKANYEKVMAVLNGNEGE